jgi:biopolymer transport protein ExbB
MVSIERRAADAARWMVAALLALLALAAPATAQEGAGWWNKDWPYRRALTVDTSPSGANLSGAIGRTVLLVRLHSGNYTFEDGLENGADLRVIDSDGKTPLPFHIERFDAANGIATLWVSVPNVNGGEKRALWLYFGNKNAPAGSDIPGTFDPDTIANYHFAENAGQAAKDVTANHFDAQNAAPGVDENGAIGRAARFNGAQGLLVPAAAPIAAGGPFTFSTWVKPGAVGAEQAVFARGPLVVGLAGGVPFASVGAQRIQATAPLAPNAWGHLAFVADGQALRLYVNGVEAAQAAGALPALDGLLTLGGADGRPFAGELDEARLSKTARPAAMIAAQAQAEGPQNKVVAVADAAERQSEGGGTFFFVLSKVETIDAVIIALCLLLLAGAIAVMVAKTRYLSRADRANAAFMKRFRAMHEDLVSTNALDIPAGERALIADAPLARLYEVGIDELDVRRARGRHALSGEAVEAMRAAVDAQVVEENQKLDRWMVLLTIAISGGPFIGLLGTVLGVMNTFAGVAIAGDVNVNAIAPGIAAALMATIAGLTAAIPSLFGYNYLNARISALSDTMRVFVDRLITRLAETQHDAPPPALRAAE